MLGDAQAAAVELRKDGKTVVMDHNEGDWGGHSLVATEHILRLARDSDLAAIVAFAASKYRTSLAALSILTGRRQVLLAAIGTHIVETSRDDSFCARAIQNPEETMIVPDALCDTRFSNMATVTGEPHIRFYAGVPIINGKGYAVGALCIADRAPLRAPFDDSDLKLRAREVELLLRF